MQKDGWTYALEAGSGSCSWQFPPTAGPGCKFAPGGAHIHGDTDYKRPGAAWEDVLVINTGGEALVHDGVGQATAACMRSMPARPMNCIAFDGW